MSLSTHETKRIPETEQLFMVGGNAYEDLIFKCIRCDGSEIKSRVDGHEYVIIGQFVNRLAAIEDEELRADLVSFRA